MPGSTPIAPAAVTAAAPIASKAGAAPATAKLRALSPILLTPSLSSLNTRFEFAAPFLAAALKPSENAFPARAPSVANFALFGSFGSSLALRENVLPKSVALNCASRWICSVTSPSGLLSSLAKISTFTVAIGDHPFSACKSTAHIGGRCQGIAIAAPPDRHRSDESLGWGEKARPSHFGPLRAALTVAPVARPAAAPEEGHTE